MKTQIAIKAIVVALFIIIIAASARAFDGIHEDFRITIWKMDCARYPLKVNMYEYRRDELGGYVPTGTEMFELAQYIMKWRQEALNEEAYLLASYWNKQLGMVLRIVQKRKNQGQYIDETPKGLPPVGLIWEKPPAQREEDWEYE